MKQSYTFRYTKGDSRCLYSSVKKADSLDSAISEFNKSPSNKGFNVFEIKHNNKIVWTQE